MKNYRFYLYTAVLLSIFFVATCFWGGPYLLKSNGSISLENEISLAKLQARQIATLGERMFEDGLDKSNILESIRKAIEESSEDEDVFLSVLDWSGKIVSHPDVTRITDPAPQSDLVKSMESSVSGGELYDYILSLSDSLKKAKKSEIIYLTAIDNSDWIVAAHMNTSNILIKRNQWKDQMLLVFLIVALSVLVIALAAIRWVSSYYEGQIALKTNKFEDGVLNLSKLNNSLENYQKKLTEITNIGKAATQSDVEVTKEKEKQRILTYVRNELMPISTEDIAYIYVENTITYIVRKDGKRSTSSESLDQIYSYLNEASFFRANRQIIVAISAIEKILKYGNSKLKIQVRPASEIDIIIGKNKAAAFKQWLDL